MKKIIIIIAIVIILGAGWYFVSPLLFNKEVNESFPFAEITKEEMQEIVGSVADLEISLPSFEEMKNMTQEELDQLEKEIVEISNMEPGTVMDEELELDASETQESGPTLLSSGEFIDADNFHKGSGDASVYKLLDGSKILRLENFRVTNGPDLRVILTKNPSPDNRKDVQEGYVELGKLKGNVGNQNYEIPSSLELSEYKGVVIYCKPFHVVFSTATLN